METPNKDKSTMDLGLNSSSCLLLSTTSSLSDTPGDSGVLCLDSEISEVAGQALMTHSLAGAEDLTCDSICDAGPSCSQDGNKSLTSSIFSHSDNLDRGVADDELSSKSHAFQVYDNLPDVVLRAYENVEKSSKISEPKKCLSEDIVYRRKCKKKSMNGQSSQKKRVSFHEDILNNTKTDNIHIERGFVSYASNSSYCERFRQKNNMNDRFSWCASGDQAPKYAMDVAQHTLSDILTYGNVETDKSGIFEYCSDNDDRKNNNIFSDSNVKSPKSKLYKCDSNSSDSNFSCDSESSSDSNSNKDEILKTSQRNHDKTKKSFSCDEFEENGHIPFMRKTYFSEADIDQTYDHTKKPLEVTQSPVITVKSVLKKKRYIMTNVVEERKHSRNVLNLLDANNILDSLKKFYRNFNFTTVKGLPENSIDTNNAVEALSCDVNQNKELAKSLDSGLQIDDDDEFIEITLDTISPKEKPVNTENIDNKTSNDNSPRHKLTLNMKPKSEKPSTEMNGTLPIVNKYVVNCESTVYEHKGVSYSYVHDTFQTSFEAPKQCFTPIPESTPVKEPVSSAIKNDFSMDISPKSTPKKAFSKCITSETKESNMGKHLSSPKKQNYRHGRRQIVQKIDDENLEVGDNWSNVDNCTLKGSDDTSEDMFDNRKLQVNKSALLNRYLRNVCQKKEFDLKLKNNKFFKDKIKSENPFPNIIFPFKEVSESFGVLAKRIDHMIEKEVVENRRLSVRLLTADEPSYFDSFEDNVAVECNEKLKLEIFTHPGETLHRMMKVRTPYNMEDGLWTPLLVFITDYALYVASVKPGATEYTIHCNLPHSELDAITFGPDGQYIQVIDTFGSIACTLICGDWSLGNRLVSSLEWCARTSPVKPLQPPALIQLTTQHLMMKLAPKLPQRWVPQVLFYGQACLAESGYSAVEPAGTYAPPLEGYLMCRTHNAKRFEPYYFLLRAGVLQWGPHSPDGSPLPHTIALRSVVGVRRYMDTSRRPHCFEIALGDRTSLLLAAPDDPTASSWLQSLLLHAAQALEVRTEACPRGAGHPAGCSVVVTSHEVLTVREELNGALASAAAAYLHDRGAENMLKEYVEKTKNDVKILTRGSIKNLTAFRIPDNDDNWCCLEWGVCEAGERGAGLAAVLASAAELDRLVAAVGRAHAALTNEPFPLCVVDAKKLPCFGAHSRYEAAWSHMLPSQQ